MKLKRAKFTVVLLTIGGLAFLIGIGLFLFLPTLKDDVALSAKISAAHAELDAQYANRKNLLSSLDKAQTARETMRALSSQFVPVGKELDFITALEALAAKDGVEERVTLKEAGSGRAAQELRETFELIVNGSYRQAMQMLVDIEKMPNLVIVDSVLVRPGPGSSPGAPSFLSITLRGSLVAPPSAL